VEVAILHQNFEDVAGLVLEKAIVLII